MSLLFCPAPTKSALRAPSTQPPIACGSGKTTEKNRTPTKAGRPHRNYRCSRCGEEGHNVRACPVRLNVQWFHQRCGRCGLQGHNARNCMGVASSSSCTVCNGAARLVCSKCNGIESTLLFARRSRPIASTHTDGDPVMDSPLVIGSGIPLSPAKKKMAEHVRNRRSKNKYKNNEELVGESEISSEDKQEYVSKYRSKVSITAPILSTTSRTAAKSVAGYLSSESDLTNCNDDEPCTRCMGSGYLTCMACN